MVAQFIVLFSALVIVKPLPEETHLMPGEDLNLSITINASIVSEDEITLSLGHSSSGLYEDLTDYLVYDLIKQDDDFDVDDVDDDDEYDVDGEIWDIDITLPHPHSQASGDLTLSVGDSHSGDITTTRLVIGKEGKDVAPFFDPLPKSVKAYTGQKVFINTEAKGSTPIKVSWIILIFIIAFKLNCILYHGTYPT